MRRLLLVCLVLVQISALPFDSQNEINKAIIWSEDKVKTMSLDEMIGQLFMIRAHSDLGNDHIADVKKQIEKYKVGGLCFFQGTPSKQAALTNQYQALSEIPLMIAIDGEWGLGMRFKDKYAISFPKQLTLGAIKHNDIIYEMGKEVARQMNRIGIHVNFAPVLDVNNNPSNPVIHNRSFGEDVFNVAEKSYAYMKGMQDGGLIACAKHFPGHGDTSVDSHYDLPLIKHRRARLDSLELAPFKSIIDNGVKSIMTAHLQVPALDDRDNRPTSLSANVVTGVLKEELKFEGLVFTDAMEMKGVAKHFTVEESTVEALLAGNDIILLPIDIHKAVKGIKTAIKEGKMDSSFIAEKAKKILKHKYLVGLKDFKKIHNINGIPEDLLTNEAIALKSKLYEQAITLIQEENVQLPIKDIENKKIAVLSLGVSKTSAFQKRFDSYLDVEKITTSKTINLEQQTRIKNKLSAYDIVFIGLHDMSIYESKNYGISKDQLDLIFKLNSQNKVVLVNFGSPYAIKYFENIPNIIQAYEDDDLCQDITAQIIMGAHGFRGTLPVSVGSKFPFKSGLFKPDLSRLKYGVPERVGMKSDTLKKIEKIVEEMIKEKAAPGCQVLAIKDGQVVYEKSFGYHTFNKKVGVRNDHIYDVASVTKVLATTISLMKLEDNGLIALEKNIEEYLPEIDTSNKGDLVIQDVLAHHAKLPGWIPFYEATLEKDKKKKEVPVISIIDQLTLIVFALKSSKTCT